LLQATSERIDGQKRLWKCRKVKGRGRPLASALDTSLPDMAGRQGAKSRIE